jgi:hypothetical protein
MAGVRVTMRYIPMDERNIQIYVQASNWLRMTNTMAWTVTSVFFPLSLGCFALAINEPSYAWLFASGSIILYIIWMYMIFFYSIPANICRDALEEIEYKWKLADKEKIYTRQGKLYKKKYGALTAQIIFFVIIIMGWVFLLMGLKP